MLVRIASQGTTLYVGQLESEVCTRLPVGWQAPRSGSSESAFRRKRQVGRTLSQAPRHSPPRVDRCSAGTRRHRTVHFPVWKGPTSSFFCSFASSSATQMDYCETCPGRSTSQCVVLDSGKDAPLVTSNAAYYGVLTRGRTGSFGLIASSSARDARVV